MQDDEALDRAGADKCINPNCEQPRYLWGKDQRVMGYCPLCRKKTRAAVGSATGAEDAAALTPNTAALVTPARIGYSTYIDWANRVDEEFQTAIDKSLSVGDGGMAAYFKLMQMEHRQTVEKQKAGYRGL